MSEPIISSPAELAEKIQAFPEHCKENKVRMTAAGFTLFCGYSNKASLWDLKNRKKDGGEYRNLMGMFSLMLEEQSASNLLKPGQPTAGCIFNLLNNCGDTPRWVNRQELVAGGGPVIQVVSSIDRESLPLPAKRLNAPENNEDG